MKYWAVALMLTIACPVQVSASAQRPSSFDDKGMASQPWSAYFKQAAGQYEQGNRDDAGVWLYIAQMRARAQINCDMAGDSADMALYGSMSEVVGRPINEHVYGSIARAIRTIDAALDWDAANPDPRLASDACQAALETARTDKREQREWTLENAAQIRQTRTENRLPNEGD